MSAQGTWEFSSLARIKDPRSRPHALSDDLESFFWVLMYEIVHYRDWKSLFSKQEIQEVFCRPTGFFGRSGIGKFDGIFDYTFSSFLIEILVKTPCCKIIEEMRSLFGGLYANHSMDTSISSLEQSTDEERTGPGRGPPVSESREKLRTSDAFLAILEKHLQSEWDIDNDGSLDRPDLQPDGSASRKRLKRKAEDRSDSEENINVRRKGRLPPSTEESASDEDASRTCYPSSDSEWEHQSVSHDDDSSSISSRDSWVE